MLIGSPIGHERFVLVSLFLPLLSPLSEMAMLPVLLPVLPMFPDLFPHLLLLFSSALPTVSLQDLLLLAMLWSSICGIVSVGILL
jgi:hypothetical protein